MTYWQIIKERRESLRLSIDDVSAQTRLAPEFLEAIEENRLTVFRNDLSFVPRYIQSYCTCIGINYPAIAQDVEVNLSSYARRKNIPYQPLVQKRAVPVQNRSTKTSAKKSSGTKKKSSGSQSGKKNSSKKKTSKNSASGSRKKKSSSARVRKNSTSARRKAQQRKARKRRLIRIMVFLGVVLLAGLFVLNGYMDAKNAALEKEEEAKRQEELAAKEEETQKLAEQKKNGVSSQVTSSDSLEITASDSGQNTYIVTDTTGNVSAMKFDITLPTDSTVKLYKDGTLVTTDTESEYSGSFSITSSVENGTTLILEIGTYDGGAIQINGQNLEVSDDAATGSVLQLTFVFYTDTTSSDSTQSDLADTEDESDTADSDTDT